MSALRVNGFHGFATRIIIKSAQMPIQLNSTFFSFLSGFLIFLESGLFTGAVLFASEIIAATEPS